jgi:hypothetical protein
VAIIHLYYRLLGVVETIVGLILLYISIVLRLLLQVKVDVVNNEKTRCFNCAIVQLQHNIYSILRCVSHKQTTTIQLPLSNLINCCVVVVAFSSYDRGCQAIHLVLLG